MGDNRISTVQTNENITETSPSAETIIAFKGFDAQLQCRGFQFEIGKTYQMDFFRLT